MVAALKKQTRKSRPGDKQKDQSPRYKRKDTLEEWMPKPEGKEENPFSPPVEGDKTGSGLYRVLPAGDKGHNKGRVQIH